MPLDAAAITAVKNELCSKILDGRVDKVYQPERDEICLVIRCGSENHRLLVSADSSNPRIHLTEYSKPNPLSAPMFCMLLRKHLINGKITKIHQPGFERIIEISVESYNDLGDLTTKRLVAEIMGRNSNILLLSEEGRIVECAKRVDITVSSVRTLLPGLTYEPPPAQDRKNPMEASYNEVFEAFATLSGEPQVSRAVVSLFLGMSPLAGREISHRATGDADARLTAINLNSVARRSHEFFEKISAGEFSPNIIMGDGGAVRDFAVYNLSMYEGIIDTVPMPDICRAMDEFYYLKDKHERMRQRTSAIRKTASNLLERARKKLILLQERLHDAENKEKFRIYGELITANLYRVRHGDEVLEAENFYDNNNMVSIPLDKRLYPPNNAQAYFKKYKKAKTAEIMAAEQIEKTIKEIRYMETVLNAIDMAESEGEIADIKRELSDGGYIKKEKVKGNKRPDVSKPIKIETEDGWEIYIGKNNRQNDMVTFKIGRSGDLWLHVKNIPGSHVIVKRQGDGFSDKIIERAASLAAYYSSARQSPMVEVDYTEVKNVKKPPGAAPGMVIYDKYKTAYVKPLNTIEKG